MNYTLWMIVIGLCRILDGLLIIVTLGGYVDSWLIDLAEDGYDRWANNHYDDPVSADERAAANKAAYYRGEWMPPMSEERS